MNVLLTGASSGIGAALSLACARRGDALFLCGRDRERLDGVAAQCRAAGAASVRSDIVDVRDSGAMRRWILSCDAEAPLERVFANAGVSTGEETEENARRTFDINVGGCVNTVFPALEAFRSGRGVRGRRQIVITSSIAGYAPLKACPSYSATKACVKTWGLSLRGALAAEGIGVSVVCPGFVRSRITDKNTCPMPFFMEAPSAASKILRGVDANRGLIAFPWPMRFSAWILSALPHSFCSAVNRFLPKKADS